MGRKITNPKPPAKRRSPAMTNPEKFCAEELAEKKYQLEHEPERSRLEEAFLAGASARAEYTAKVVGEVRERIEAAREVCAWSIDERATDARDGCDEALRLLETLGKGEK